MIPEISIIGDTRIIINGQDAILKRCNSTRRIFFSVCGAYVLKLEDEEYANRSYFLQCKNENKLWNKKITHEDKKYFAPTLLYKHTKEYDYVVQPRFVFRKRTSRKYFLKINELCAKYGLGDLGDVGLNWRVTVDGIPIIHDYGV
jgi:hypothetical protein